MQTHLHTYTITKQVWLIPINKSTLKLRLFFFVYLVLIHLILAWNNQCLNKWWAHSFQIKISVEWTEWNIKDVSWWNYMKIISIKSTQGFYIVQYRDLVCRYFNSNVHLCCIFVVCILIGCDVLICCQSIQNICT